MERPRRPKSPTARPDRGPCPGPSFLIEADHSGPVAGVDEAGRGALAGPVVAAAVILDRTRIPDGINDSKLLPRHRRETLYGEIMATAVVGVGEATVDEIDRFNILGATLIAMARAVDALDPCPTHVLVDGNQRPTLRYPLTCVVGGDSLSLSIAAASIIAKVHRDRLLGALAAMHPAFGWDTNAGYGTPAHQKALKLVGATPFHRRSFAPIRELETQDFDTTL